MRSILCTIALGMSMHSAGSAAEPVWGAPVNGMRLGVSIIRARSGEASMLQVVFENTDTREKTILLGGRSGIGPIYNLTFHAKDSRGHTCEVLNLTAGVVAGYVGPIVIHLHPGTRYDASLLMNKLICVRDRVDTALDALLREGYLVRVVFTADQKGADWGRVVNPWLGVMESGDIKP